MAAPCAGFADVDAGSAFCPSIEWVRNRAVTLGCGAAAYCPDVPVSRLAMAAFMNRLGSALTPRVLRVDTAPGAIDPGTDAIACVTDALAVTGYPRRALADLVFSASAAAEVSIAADLALTTNDGTTWTPLNAHANRGTVAAGQWSALTDLASVDLDVGQTVRFGVRVSRGGVPGTAALTDSRCQLRVFVHTRDGTSSPL